jgi:IclR family mhp operon transcriptional activator
MHVIDLLENGALVDEILADGYATRGYNRFTHNPGKTSSIAVPIFAKDNGVAGTLTLAFFSSSTKMADAVAQFSGPLRDTALAIQEDI